MKDFAILDREELVKILSWLRSWPQACLQASLDRGGLPGDEVKAADYRKIAGMIGSPETKPGYF